MRIAYIMRGLPGSGKSTIARKLAGDTGRIHSTDEFFVVSGKYRYESGKLREYHEENFRRFCESLLAGIEVVVCDNTNVRRREFSRYVEAAEQAGYLVALVVMPHPDPAIAARRNLHGVPERSIRQMLARWEQ